MTTIIIFFQALSREHACIEIRGDSHLIYDKNSRNKTKRNKVKKLIRSLFSHSCIYCTYIYYIHFVFVIVYVCIVVIISPLHQRGVYCFTSACPSVRPKIFFVAFFSATINGINLIFGHKLHIGIPYRGKRFWNRHIPTSCLPTWLVFIFIEHICGGIISEQLLTVHLVIYGLSEYR